MSRGRKKYLRVKPPGSLCWRLVASLTRGDSKEFYNLETGRLDISGIMYLSESGLFPEIGRFTAFNDVLISLKSILADPRKERFCFESEKNPLCLLGGDEKNPRIIRKSTYQIYLDIRFYT